MWEVTLIGKPSDILHFLELKNKLKNKLLDDVIVVITFDKNLVISIALKSKDNILYVQKQIYAFMIRIVKLEFYGDNLKIFDDEKSLNNYLISNLANFGLQDEINYSMHSTHLPIKIVIRSFIFFKCQNLIQMWRKDIAYFNRYFSRLSGSEKYIDYLKIVATTSRAKSDILYLTIENDEIIILDSKNNKIKKLNKLDEVEIISSLLMLSPKKIIINCLDTMGEKVTNIISYIFEDRVSVLL